MKCEFSLGELGTLEYAIRLAIIGERDRLAFNEGAGLDTDRHELDRMLTLYGSVRAHLNASFQALASEAKP